MFPHYLQDKVLSICINTNGFDYCKIINKKPTIVKHFQLEAQNTTHFFELFSEIVNKELANEQFDLVDLNFISKQFSLIPDKYFEGKSLKDIFANSTFYTMYNALRYNNISNDIKVVYKYQDDIEFFMQKQFSNVRIVHSSFRTIQNIVSQHNDGLFLILHQNMAEFLLIDNTKIVLYTMEEYTTNREIWYYINNIFQQTQQKKTVYLVGNNNKVTTKLLFLNGKGLDARRLHNDIQLSELFPFIYFN